MSSPRRVTQLDIAKRAGVHGSTVSLALKNHPGIPEATRERIHAIAVELGYAPDPMMSALSSYRTSLRKVPFRGTLAWLVNHGGGVFDWQAIPVFKEYYLGAKEEGERHGYNVDIFNLNRGGADARKMALTLESRNISGILLCPQNGPDISIEFPWHKFSTVTFGYSLAAPRFHIVASAQYRCISETMRRLRGLGYRRIGYVVWRDFDRRSENNALAAYVVEEYLAQNGIPIPPLIGNFTDPEVFLPWFKKHRPDAIVTADVSFIRVLKKLKFAVPGELGFACFALSGDNSSSISGMNQNPMDCGRVAVKFLTGMIQRGERGVPESQQQLLVSGRWVPGASLRKRKP